MKKTFAQAGYDEESVEKVLMKGMEGEKGKKDEAGQEADEDFKARVKRTFGQVGYDEESIEKILMKGEKYGKKHETKIPEVPRPTYIKVHRKHIRPETLDEFELPWDWDEVNNAFLSSFYKKSLSLTALLPARLELHHH